jgi:hypothetical protein
MFDIEGAGGIAMRLNDVSSSTVLRMQSEGGPAATRNFSIGANQDGWGYFGITQSNAKNGDPVAAGTTRISITDLGAIGINTTTALARFAVNGGAHIGGDSDPGDNNLTIDGATSTATLAVTSTSVFTGTATFSSATASTAAVFDASKVLSSSVTTLAELAFVSGVTSSIQTQLNARQREPKYASGDPNTLGTTGDDDGQMFMDTATGNRWFWYATLSTWLP